jgi:CheY-like chemotaxis protein
MLGRTIGALIRVETSLAADLWPAQVDANQIELAILNLAVNARDAMPRGGTLSIRTANHRRGSPELPPELMAGEYVEIAVSDTGSGMSVEVVARAFEPFFTTKPVGKGSGLGLSQVYGIARQSNGTATITSQAGRGTAVRIYLPRAPAAGVLPADLAGEVPATPAEGCGDILLVDDDAEIRQLTATALRERGHHVDEADSGAVALDLVDRGAAIDLLIVDFAMAGMTGTELARVVRARRPGLPVLVMTGYANAPLLDGELGDAHLLKKPFRTSDFVATVEGMLATRPMPPAANILPFRKA